MVLIDFIMVSNSNISIPSKTTEVCVKVKMVIGYTDQRRLVMSSVSGLHSAVMDRCCVQIDIGTGTVASTVSRATRTQSAD